MIQNKQQNIFNLFKLPDIIKEGTLIGILDASGSMKSKWPYLVQHYNELKRKVKQTWTITFDSKPYFCFQKDLTLDFKKYGGGETDIIAAFEHLNDLLEFLPNKEQITVLFVSDGKDSYSDIEKRLLKLNPPKIQNLNFISLGIGREFPTFIAMKLRQIYHTGDSAVSPLYIIKGEGLKPKSEEELKLAIEKMFKKQFYNISTQIRHQQMLTTSPILEFPWEEKEIEKAWSGSWVIADTEEIQIDNQMKLQMIRPNRQQILEIGFYWLRQLQLMGLQRSVLREARATLRVFNVLLNNQKCSFAERVLLQEGVLDIISELKQMAEEDVLSKLNEEQAAQRMLIGTKVGKFYGKLIKKRLMSLGEFEQYRNELIASIENNKLNDTEVERSVITLQNQKEILQEQDLITGLSLCPSQYQFVISFPIIGFGLEVRRSDSVQVEPYHIQIISLAKHHKYLDSVTMIEGANQELVLSVGDGDKETINCILPLYRKQDLDLKPFLKSKLFEVLMTYMVSKNADAILGTSYMALLSNTFYFLLRQPPSKYNQDMMNLITESYELVYGDDEKYQYHTQHLINAPQLTLADYNNIANTKCEDLVKPLLILNSIKNNIQPQQLKNIVTRIIIEAIGRSLKQQDIFEFFITWDRFKDTIINQIIQNVGSNFNPKQYPFAGDMSQRKFEIQLQINICYEKLQNQPFKIEVHKQEIIQALSKQKYSYEALQSIHEYYLGTQFDDHLLIIAVYHARLQNSWERAQSPLIEDINQILNQEIVNIVKDQIRVSKIFPIVLVMIKERFPDLFCQKQVIKQNIDDNPKKIFHHNSPGMGQSRKRRRRPVKKFNQ